MAKARLQSTSGRMQSDRMDRSFEQYIPKPKAGCDCISYNGHSPDRRGTPETVLTVPDWVTRERRTVCVDACIADHVKALWDAGIWTEASCCGHNRLFPRNIVVDRANHAKAQAILDARKAKVQIISWQLCGDAPIESNEGLQFPKRAHQQRCAECDCDDPPKACNWIKSEQQSDGA